LIIAKLSSPLASSENREKSKKGKEKRTRKRNNEVGGQSAIHQSGHGLSRIEPSFSFRYVQ
jgi:hypothetical protein